MTTATAPRTVSGPKVVKTLPPPVLLVDGDRILIEGYGRPFYRTVRFNPRLAFPSLRDEPSIKHGLKLCGKDRVEIAGKVYGFDDLVHRNGLEHHRYHEA